MSQNCNEEDLLHRERELELAKRQCQKAVEILIKAIRVRNELEKNLYELTKYGYRELPETEYQAEYQRLMDLLMKAIKEEINAIEIERHWHDTETNLRNSCNQDSFNDEIPENSPEEQRIISEIVPGLIYRFKNNTDGVYDEIFPTTGLRGNISEYLDENDLIESMCRYFPTVSKRVFELQSIHKMAVDALRSAILHRNDVEQKFCDSDYLDDELKQQVILAANLENDAIVEESKAYEDQNKMFEFMYDLLSEIVVVMEQLNYYVDCIKDVPQQIPLNYLADVMDAVEQGKMIRHINKHAAANNDLKDFYDNLDGLERFWEILLEHEDISEPIRIPQHNDPNVPEVPEFPESQPMIMCTNQVNMLRELDVPRITRITLDPTVSEMIQTNMRDLFIEPQMTNNGTQTVLGTQTRQRPSAIAGPESQENEQESSEMITPRITRITLHPTVSEMIRNNMRDLFIEPQMMNDFLMQEAPENVIPETETMMEAQSQTPQRRQERVNPDASENEQESPENLISKSCKFIETLIEKLKGRVNTEIFSQLLQKLEEIKMNLPYVPAATAQSIIGKLKSLINRLSNQLAPLQKKRIDLVLSQLLPPQRVAKMPVKEAKEPVTQKPNLRSNNQRAATSQSRSKAPTSVPSSTNLQAKTQKATTSRPETKTTKTRSTQATSSSTNLRASPSRSTFKIPQKTYIKQTSTRSKEPLKLPKATSKNSIKEVKSSAASTVKPKVLQSKTSKTSFRPQGATSKKTSTAPRLQKPPTKQRSEAESVTSIDNQFIKEIEENVLLEQELFEKSMNIPSSPRKTKSPTKPKSPAKMNAELLNQSTRSNQIQDLQNLSSSKNQATEVTGPRDHTIRISTVSDLPHETGDEVQETQASQTYDFPKEVSRNVSFGQAGSAEVSSNQSRRTEQSSWAPQPNIVITESDAAIETSTVQKTSRQQNTKSVKTRHKIHQHTLQQFMEESPQKPLKHRFSKKNIIKTADSVPQPKQLIEMSKRIDFLIDHFYTNLQLQHMKTVDCKNIMKLALNERNAVLTRDLQRNLNNIWEELHQKKRLG